MKYTIVINQKAVIDAELNLDIIDLAIFDFIRDFYNKPKVVRMNSGGKSYVMLTHKLIINALPILGITTRQGIYNRLQKLVSADLLEPFEGNGRTVFTSYFCFGANYSRMFFDEEGVNENSNVSMKLYTGVNETLQGGVNETLHYNSNNNIILNNLKASAKAKNKKNATARTQKKDVDFSIKSQNTQPPKKMQSVAAPFFSAPTKEEIVKYFTDSGASKTSGERFFNQFDAVNWTSKGEKIIKWQSLADTWVQNEPNMKRATSSNTKNLQRKNYNTYE